MTRARARTLALSVLLLAVATVAQASWYDDYDAGIAAARNGKWSTVVQKMNAAIVGNPKENNKVKTYGMIFINYHPYYYRGIANLNLGKYEQAIADLEKTDGPGELNLGPLDIHLERAKEKLAASTTPEPEPAPAPVRPEPTRPVTPTPVTPTPAVPQIDPALRQRAASALGTAKQKLQEAQQRRATASPQYSQAMSLYTDATSKNAAAKTNEDLSSIITIAQNAADLAELASPPNVPAPVTPTPTPAVASKPTAAASAVLADYTNQVRRALEYYFAGEFESAARDFRALTRTMPTNGWIWAFLGASQYSLYAFEADDSYRQEALRSFQKAKQYRSWKGGLPEKYFSKRIRRAFNGTAG